MAAPISSTDSLQARLSKILPADVTAAFLSAEQALRAAFPGDPFRSATPIFWTFIAILVLCPFYFRYVTGVANRLHNAFLCASFVVFAVAIANLPFQTFAKQAPGGDLIAQGINIVAVSLPILWAFLISNIFLQWAGQRVDS